MLFIVGEKQPLPWDMRVRAAYYIAQALDHCNTENRKLYHDLNAYRVLFDEVHNIQTQCFSASLTSKPNDWNQDRALLKLPFSELVECLQLILSFTLTEHILWC